MKLSVLIPVYNEEMTIGELIERVARVNLGDVEMEIIVANDGSTDASAQIIEAHRAQHADLIRVYSMPIIPFNKNWFTMRVWYGNHLPSLENKWRNGDDRVDSGSNIPLCRKPKSRDGSASVALLLADGLNRCTTAVYVPCVPAVPRGAHAN